MNDLLKATFDSQAELYNEVRPRYPKELFDTLEKACNLSADAQLLEIAPGTGQAQSLSQKKDTALLRSNLVVSWLQLLEENFRSLRK